MSPINASTTLITALGYTIESKIAQGKEQTARKQVFCMKKVEKFLSGSDVELNDIDSKWLGEFCHWMKSNEKLSENTISTYIRLIYNTCRIAVRQGAQLDLRIFENCDMGNFDAMRNLPSIKDIRQLMAVDLSHMAPIERIRNIYLFSLFCGGIDPSTLINIRHQNIADDVIRINGYEIPLIETTRQLLAAISVPQSDFVLHRNDNPLSPAEMQSKIGKANEALSVITRMLGLRKQLKFEDCGKVWELTANQISIPQRTICQAQAKSTGSNLCNIADAFQQVVLSIDPDKLYWFAIRCTNSTPESLKGHITNAFPSVEVFHPQFDYYKETEHGAKKTRVNLFNQIMFLRTSMATATRMKRELRNISYIYDHPTDNGSRSVAIIPSSDIKMFMYFNEIAPEQILYYFPEELNNLDYMHMDEVIITDGKWKGGRGKIMDICKSDATKVIVAIDFPNLGISVSAPIPRIFLSSPR